MNGQVKLAASPAAKLYCKGTKVWVKDGQNVWCKACLTETWKPGQLTINVLCNDGTMKCIPIRDESDLPPVCNPIIVESVHDLAALTIPSEPDILETLRQRFERKTIYTYCGMVLISINPYERNDELYGDRMIYCADDNRNMNPHIYCIAAQAFSLMQVMKVDQSILISGESGAGKTVSASHIMNYLSECANNWKKSDSLTNQILQCSPLLEAFGNARTLNNDNSSRFGKLTQLRFTTGLVGANVCTYLLEKSRVVRQGIGEQNFHIFYQLCEARNRKDHLKNLMLDDSKEFYYLNQGGAVESGLGTGENSGSFECTMAALEALNFTDEEVDSIFRILSGLLHWGNLEIVPEVAGQGEHNSLGEARVFDNKALDAVCKLWNLNEKDLKERLTKERLTAGREVLCRYLTVEQAKVGRNAVAKMIYEQLFEWIVKRLNDSVGSWRETVNRKEMKTVNVLDIYGFEIFQRNSFEQLCINYANEVLQCHFNQVVFKDAQEEYTKEGITWNYVSFMDNSECVDLIGSPHGIGCLLDGECQLRNPSDKNWLNLVANLRKKTELLEIPKIRSDQFIVHHFAGSVAYDADGFTAKNLDAVNQNLCEIFHQTHCALLKALCSQATSEDPAVMPNCSKNPRTRRQRTTVFIKFRKSLTHLRDLIQATRTHYVRCIKPNDQKAPNIFDNHRVLEQLKACGVMETIRISASGFTNKWLHEAFNQRYVCLLAQKDRQESCAKLLAESVCKQYLEANRYTVGRSKVFLKSGQLALLELFRRKRQENAATRIQSVFRGYEARKKVARMRRALITIQNAGRAWLIWRRMKFLQMHRAAICLQSFFRMVIQRKRFAICKKLQRANVHQKMEHLDFVDMNKPSVKLIDKAALKALDTTLVIPEAENSFANTEDGKCDIAELQKQLNHQRDALNLLSELVANVACVERQEILKDLKCADFYKPDDNVVPVFSDGKQPSWFQKLKMAQSSIGNTALALPLQEISKDTSGDETVSISTVDDWEQKQMERMNGMLIVNDENALMDVLMNQTITTENDETIIRIKPNEMSHILLMIIRYYDHVHCATERSLALLRSIAEMVNEKVMNASLQRVRDIVFYWIQTARFLHSLLLQYSGDERYQTDKTKSLIRRFQFRQPCHINRVQPAMILLKKLHRIMRLSFIKQKIDAAMVINFLECQSECGGTQISKLHLVEVIKLLYDAMCALKLFPSTCDYILSCVTKEVTDKALKVMMLRDDLCNFIVAVRIKHNTDYLIRWFKANKLPRSADAFEPLVQATYLLQTPKEDKNIQSLGAMCSRLQVNQVVQLLKNYIPYDTFDSRPSAMFIDNVKQALNVKQSGGCVWRRKRTEFQEERNACTPPFHPSTVDFTKLKVPKLFIGCTSMA